MAPHHRRLDVSETLLGAAEKDVGLLADVVYGGAW
jgi:hypothetical protein